MNFFKKLRALPQEELGELARLCAGASLLMGIAFVLSGAGSFTLAPQSLPAATALGEIQGWPHYPQTFLDYPDYSFCTVNFSSGVAPEGPACDGYHKNFYTSVFSINPTDTPGIGQSVWKAGSFVAEGYIPGSSLGPTPYNPWNCNMYPIAAGYDYNLGVMSDDIGNANCYSFHYGYYGYYGSFVPIIGSSLGGLYLGPTPYNPWNCNMYPIAAGYDYNLGVMSDDIGNANCFSFRYGSFPSIGSSLGGLYLGGTPYNPFKCDMFQLPAGYSATNGDYILAVSDGESPSASCIPYKHVPEQVDSASSYALLYQGTAGSLPSVAPGSSLTLEWSCLPSRFVRGYARTSGGFGCGIPGVGCAGGWSSFEAYNLNPVSTGATGSGPLSSFDFTGGSVKDSRTIMVPSPAVDTTYNYTLKCEGPYNLPTMTIPVTVRGTDDVQLPSITISGPSTMTVGESASITATFLPGTGDTLGSSAINGCAEPDVSNPYINCQISVIPPAIGTLASKTYSFTPTKVGTYYFYPAVLTPRYPWSTYQKRLVITVSAQPSLCTGPEPKFADRCSQTGAAKNKLVDSCTGQLCEWTCSFGFEKQGKVCKRIQCTDPHAINPPACDECETGYQMVGGICVNVPALELSASPPRVKSGATATVSWSVTGLVEDSEVSCSITSNPTGAFSASIPAQDGWIGSKQTAGITGTTIITLSCTNATSRSVTVGLIPTIWEI